MKRSLLRSVVFTLAFYSVTAVLCIAYLPALLLPRKIFTGLVRLWIYAVTILEYVLLGLSFEVRGKEHLPKSGSYIIAAKHQSAYETIKLRILFRDPAIILKKELLSIPLWGWYLKKSGVIAIDRGTPERALKSIEEGAVQMAEAGRPIVIFVQGTRTRPNETPDDKPYKPGAARIQQITDLPIIPMALNSGLFWPKGFGRKSGGKVVFELFAPITPGQNRKDLIKDLQVKLEAETNRLMNEARAVELNEKPTTSKKKMLIYTAAFALFLTGYTVLWNKTAEKAREIYIAFLKDVAETERLHAEPEISGWPGPIHLSVAEDSVRSGEGSLYIQNLTMSAWPIPFTAIHIKTGPITVRSFRWSNPLAFDSMEAWVTYYSDRLKIHDSYLYKGDFEASAVGTVNLKQEPFPKFDMNVRLKNFSPFIGHLAELGILKNNEALFTNAGLSMLASGSNEVSLPITQNGQTLYAGPLPVASLPAANHPEPGNPLVPDQ